ncbi:MAG: hypothetical protein ACYC3I_04560 [Gemmataceae bacterium]
MGSTPITRSMDANGKARRCARCRQTKPLSEFRRKGLNGLQPYCRPCQSEYHKEHYQKNKEAYFASARHRKKRLLAVLQAAKDKLCADCGIKYPYYVMDFDHGDVRGIRGAMNRFIRSRSLKTALEEIAKCEVVCSNCHRERTYQRKQYRAKKYRMIEESGEIVSDMLP